MHLSIVLLQGDFFSYSIDLNSWTLISSDTFMDGGPRLIYDHQVRLPYKGMLRHLCGHSTCACGVRTQLTVASQMCYDGGTRCLYVFGGKVLTRLVRCNFNLKFISITLYFFSTPASETSLGTYSGLYVFHTVSKQWTCLK